MELPNQLELQTLFSGFLFEAGLSAVSVKNYLSDLRHFLSFCASISSQDNPPTVQEIFQSVSKYVSQYTDEQRRSFTPQNTINRRLASIRRFSTFLNVKFGLQNEQNSHSHSPVTTSDTQKSDDSDVLPTVSKILERFRVYLVNEKKTHSTIKNYLSDLNHFFAWSAKQTPFIDQKLENLLSETQLNAYVTYLRLNHTSTSVINRRQSSIKKFTKYCFLQNFIPDNPFENKPEVPKLAPLSWLERLKSKPNNSHKTSRNRFVRLYQRYNSLPFTPYLHLALLVLATSAMVIFGYNQIIKQAAPSAAALPTVPRRQLSFQGRLTDSSGTPIVTAVNVVFKLWNDSTAGTQLYTSNTCSITPDSNGIFNTLIGNGTCGQEIASTVFTENRDVYLEITVGSETLTPRQQIATVGYALNSETLQGYPASATATLNTIPLVDQNGDINIAASSPTINSTSGTFTVTGQALTLSTAANSGGDIILQPDAIGGGNVQVLGSTTSTDTFRIENANLTSGNLISGYIGNNTSTGNLISLSSGSTETNRFLVGANGRTIINTNGGTDSIFSASSSGTTRFTIASNGNLLATGTLSGLTGLSVASGTVSLPAGEINNTEISELDWTKLQNYPTACPAGQAVQAVGDTLTCVDIAAASGNLWQRTSGSLAPLYTSDSLNLGSTATSSALVHLAGTSGENSWINTGNFGVGLTNPGTALDVTGTGRFSAGLTLTSGAINLTSTSGVLSLTGLSASSINTGINTLTVTSSNFNTTATGINSTNIGATTPGTGAFTTLSSTGATTLGNNSSTVAINSNSWDINSSGVASGLTGISSSGNIDLSSLSSGGIVKASATTGRLSIASGGVDYENPLTFSNGLTRSVNAVQLGGTLTADTNIPLGGFDMVFSGTGNVGIGLTNPTYTLDVTGDINLTGALRDNSSAGTNGQILSSTGTGIAWINAPTAGSDNLWQENGSVLSPVNILDAVNLGNTATASATVHLAGTTGDNSFINTGNFGIGTTTPGSKLTVNGTLTSSGGAINLNDSSNFATNINTGTSTGAVTIGGGALTQTVAINSADWDISTTGVITNSDSYNGLVVTANTGVITTGTWNASLIPLAYGGTNKNMTAVNGGIVWTDSDSMEVTVAGTAGQILQSNGAAAPSWINTSSITGVNQGWTWNTGVLYPTSITDAVNLGNAATASATVHLAGKTGDNSFINTGNFGIGDTTPAATLTVGSGDLFQVAGATGNITTAGDINVNGDNINADGTLAILGATGLSLQATTGTVTLDSIAANQIINIGTSNVARTINMGTGTGVDTINIGTGATGADLITIGSANAGNVTIRSNATLSLTGGTNSVIDFPNFDVATTGDITTAGDINVNGGDIFSSGDLTINPTGGDVFLGVSDNLGLTAATNLIFGGTTSLGETTAANDSGAYLVGVFDDFTYSNGTNVQQVLKDIDSQLALSSNLWQLNSGAIAPLNITNSLILGSAATSSATVHLAGTADDNSFINTGNFGIGLTNPSYKLDVVGDINLTGALRDNGSAGTSGQILTSTGTGIDWVNQSSLSAMNQGWTWNTGVLYPTSITDAVNLGNAATASATVHLAGVAGDNSFIKTGYFGVGTTNPTAILTLESTVENTIRFTDAETLRAIIGISAGAGQITAGSVDNDLVIRNQAGKIMFTTDGGVNNTMVLSGGNVGIGLTNPTYDLDVAGDINLTGQIKLGSFTTAGLPTSIGTGSLIYNTTLNVPQFYNGTAWKSVNYFDRTSDGILYPTNWYDSINLFASTGNGATSSAKIRLSGDIANNTFFVNPVAIGFTTAMESTAILQTSGHILPLNTAANNNLGKIGYSWYNLFLTSGIVDNASGTQVISTELRRLTGANWNVTGNLGVGSTTTPTQALEVTGNATISGVLNTGGSVYVGGDELNVKNGTGKINAGTVDPPYTINGQKYATYMASMIGVKEEVVGNIITTKNDHIPGLGYRALIDLDQQPVGSDLWLFSKTTNIQSHINDLSVLLTPEGKGKAWYKIDSENKILAIYSSNPTSVTYRLTAPRFDSARWTNTRGNSIVGFVINDYNNYSNTTSIFDNPATDPELIAKLDGTFSLIVNGEEVNEVSSLAEGIIANFKAGLAVITNLVAENLTVRTKLVSPLADIDQLKVIDATISGTLYADNIQGQTVDTLNQEINLLNERYSTASAILTDLQAKYGTYGELLGSISEATISADPLALSPLATTSAIIPSDLALNSLNVHTLIANDIMANGSLFAQTISAYDTDLFIQPSGDKPVHIMANIMNIYPDGKILINGDLLINGSLIAQNIDTQTATVSGTLAVGTSTIATDSANFNQLVTTGLIIASGNNNATQSGLAQTTSNASIGTAVIDQGAEEININNSRVTDTTLIYVTPTSDTKGSVLYVKSKQSGTGFTVAISGGNKPVAITFNYWLVETK